MFNWFTHPITSRALRDTPCLDGRQRHPGAFSPFYVPRCCMPQVDESDYPALLSYLFWTGAEPTDVLIDPSEVRHHQRVQLDRARARAMPASVLAKPILVSNDGYVLDGNHRAAAHKYLGSPMRAIRLDVAFEEGIRILFGFSRTYTLVPGEIRD